MIRFGPLDVPTATAPPWVQVFTETVYAYRSGQRSTPRPEVLMVSPDFAGDLTVEPVVWVWPMEGDRYGLREWQVSAIGFTEHEASEAVETLLAKPLPYGGDWREQISRVLNPERSER